MPGVIPVGCTSYVPPKISLANIRSECAANCSGSTLRHFKVIVTLVVDVVVIHLRGLMLRSKTPAKSERFLRAFDAGVPTR